MATIHCGPSVAPVILVKMNVHNGIEYGMMQAYAEGFDIFRNATSKELPEEIRYDLKPARHCGGLARRGSVVSSWLLDLTGDGFDRESDTSRNMKALFRIPGKAVGQSKPPFRKLCPPTF